MERNCSLAECGQAASYLNKSNLNFICDLHFQEVSNIEDIELLISLQIETFQGKSFVLKMTREETVLDIKKQISIKLGIPEQSQSLYTSNNSRLLNMIKVKSLATEYELILILHFDVDDHLALFSGLKGIHTSLGISNISLRLIHEWLKNYAFNISRKNS